MMDQARAYFANFLRCIIHCSHDSIFISLFIPTFCLGVLSDVYVLCAHHFFGEFCLAEVKVIGYSLARANTSMAYLNRFKPNFIAVNCLRIKIPIMPGTYFYCVFMRQRYLFCDNFDKSS